VFSLFSLSLFSAFCLCLILFHSLCFGCLIIPCSTHQVYCIDVIFFIVFTTHFSFYAPFSKPISTLHFSSKPLSISHRTHLCPISAVTTEIEKLSNDIFDLYPLPSQRRCRLSPRKTWCHCRLLRTIRRRRCSAHR